MDLKERIIENALTLFHQNGIKSMTMSDIAAESGISKRTLYEVFHNKEDLLEMCIIAHLRRVDQAKQAFIDNSEDVIDTMMHIYAQLLNNMRNVNKSFLHDLKKYHLQLYKMIECKQEEGIYFLFPLLNKGVEQGLVRKDVNFEIILWLVKSQFKALMDDSYIPTDKYSTNEFIQAIILNFIRGIATPSGNEKVDHIIGKLKNQDN